MDNRDVESEAGASSPPEDVTGEEQRVAALLQGPVELHDSVMIDRISKVFHHSVMVTPDCLARSRIRVCLSEHWQVYPAYMGNPPKVAVRTLTLGIRHGECFGMLGPNGAGKSTTINMLGKGCNNIAYTGVVCYQ